MTNYPDALRLVDPDAQCYSTIDEDYSALRRTDGGEIPPKEDLDEIWTNQKPVAVWEPREFLRRFKPQTLENIYSAANHSVQIRILIDTALSGPIHSNASDLIAGMALLVSAGILSQQESDNVLNPDWSPS